MPYSHLLQLLSAVIFLVIWFMDSFIIKYSVGFVESVPWIFRLAIALIVIIIAIWLIRSAEKVLFENQETYTIIDSGILAHVRNPLYLGVLLIYVGFFLGTFSILSGVTFIFIFVIHDQMATYEEKDLERVFGEEYLTYKREVPKWLPRLTRA